MTAAAHLTQLPDPTRAVFKTEDLVSVPTPEMEIADLKVVLARVEMDYERKLNKAITACAEHCQAREELAASHRALETTKRKARAAGLAVRPTTTFAVLQAQSNDEGEQLRRLLHRSQESLRGSW